MDKVDFSSVTLFNPSFRPGQKSDTKKTKAGTEIWGKGKIKFSEFLDEATQKGELGPLLNIPPSEEALTELMDAVHSTGSDLIDRPFHDEIMKYKRAVRNFLHYVVENGYELQKTQGIKRKVVSRGETEWKSTVFQQVKVADKKLEELAAAILSGQTTQLDRVSKIDEIKGLLVDMTITGEIKDRND